MRLSNPKWINNGTLTYNTLDQFPESFFVGANQRFSKLLSKEPVVSVIIAAYNEEANVVRCLESLSRCVSKYPFEIIVVDNNSSDRTADAIRKFNVRYVFQEIQGCGVARQLGLESASGKYVLSGDADTLYPRNWINELMAKLVKPGVVCVYGRYSFISDEKTPRWQLALYELLSDTMSIARSFKRPYLNAFGMTMGFIRDLALQVRYTEANVRGEDGRLCLDLMKFGRVESVMSDKSRVWTGTRTIAKDGSLMDAVKNRAVRLLANFNEFFTTIKPHDTKTSPSSNYDYQENLKKLKRRIGLGN